MKLMRLSLLIVILSLFFVSDVIALTKDGELYFPMEKGRTWEYRVNKVYNVIDKEVNYTMLVTNLGWRKYGKPRKVAGSYRPFVALSKKYTYYNGFEDTYYQFYGENNKGIYLIADQKKTDPQPLEKNPPLSVLIYPIKVGTTLREDVFSGYKISKIVSTTESITVKAGTFNNCIKYEAESHIAGVIGNTTSWIAPNIGLVKSIYIGEGKYGAKVITELISYKK
jgi:hypothetical protein